MNIEMDTIREELRETLYDEVLEELQTDPDIIERAIDKLTENGDIAQEAREILMINYELIEEVKQELRQELRQELEQEIRDKIDKTKIYNGLKKDMEKKLREDIQYEMEQTFCKEMEIIIEERLRREMNLTGYEEITMV